MSASDIAIVTLSETDTLTGRNPHGNTPRIPPVQYSFGIEDTKAKGEGYKREEDRSLDSNVPHLYEHIRQTRAVDPHSPQGSVSDYGDLEPQLGYLKPSLSNMQSSTSVTSQNTQIPLNSHHGLKRQDSKQVRSPGISGLLGWRRGSPNSPISPTTAFSDSRSVSPISTSPRPSPLVTMHQSQSTDAVPPPPPTTDGQNDFFIQSDASYHSSRPAHDGQYNFNYIDELLRELHDVSTELAASIRREIELEDEVDRFKTEMPTGAIEMTRRTSDYYSDSGTSTGKMPLADTETKLEALEKMRRKSEQEKAQLRLEMSQKAREDLNQIRTLEMHVQSMGAQLNSRGGGSLEATLEDTKRRLNEERQLKENYEDLLMGMKQEIESHRNERDNLRDEVVPQLRARVQGLEAQASSMQQENQSLRNENHNLANARRLQLDLQQTNHRFRSIAEEDEQGSPRSPVGLARSNSLARSKSTRRLSNSQARGKDGTTPTDNPSDSWKDLEDQRDALHRTLKALILRQDYMTKIHEKKVSALAVERDTALLEARRRAEFRFETQHLRGEVNYLKRRADDAMEQKWQCEKGLSGLKMDLDRAQQETSSLRDLLRDNDRAPVDGQASGDSDIALHSAYSNLRSVHADLIRKLHSPANTNNPRTTSLLQSVSARMQALSRQIEDQLATNAALRSRLAGAVERGVNEQHESAKKITDLEMTLQAAEVRTAVATNDSEGAVSKQEDHIRNMRESARDQSRRGVTRPALSLPGGEGGIGLGLSPRLSMLPSPRKPLFAAKSPKLVNTSSGKGVSLAEASCIEVLEMRVGELEKAGVSADREMQSIVEKMNRAQVEVVKLQAERYSTSAD